MNLADPVTAHLRRDVRPLRAETTVEALHAGVLADVAALLFYFTIGPRVLG